MTPVRIQRQRKKGWRMPPNTIYVGRPSKWGNPFVVGADIVGKYRAAGRMTNEESAEFFRIYATAAESGSLQVAIITELRGKNLACWCRLDQPCHADTLLELANSPGPANE